MGDLYGDDNAIFETCAQPTGYVSQNGDCDDALSYVYPNAAEVCDSVDNDCNGFTDDQDSGYSEPADVVFGCRW